MPEPYLEIANADGRRQVPVTDKPVTVGRHSSNVVVVMDGQASRYHCVVERTPDGFRVDKDGNLWCGWGMGSAELDGVRIFNPQGAPIGHIQLPERCANVCFGGPKRNRLFMAASHSLYALYVNTQGALGG